MDTRQNLESIANTHSRRDVLKQLGIVGAAVVGISTGGGIAYNLLVPQNAYAQTAPNERSTISQVTTSPERKELSDLTASPTLNGPDTALLSWTQPDGEFKDYEVQVGKQFYKFSSNDVKEKDGKKHVLLGQVEGKNGETLPVELKGNGYSTVIDGKATITKPEFFTVLEKEKGEKLMSGTTAYYKFEVDFPSPKKQLWSYLVGTDKKADVYITYPDWSGENVTLHKPDYEGGGIYMAKWMMDINNIPEGHSQVLLASAIGNRGMDGVKSLTMATSPNITSSELTAKSPEPKTAVEQSTWGQIKSLFK